MPPQGSQEFNLNFRSHLDQLFEITQKFRDHIIIMGGDVNASITQPKYLHDAVAKSALCEMKLDLPDHYPESNTFFLHNSSSRHLDYILSMYPDLLEVQSS